MTEAETNNTARREPPATTDVKTEDISAVVANVASRVAALNVSSMAKAYEKLVVPAFPSSGEMTNWQIAVGLACVCSGGFSDELEVDWLSECSLEQKLRRASSF